MTDHRDAYVAADRAHEMCATQGWEELARWVTEQIEMDRQSMERGCGSWDEYQRTVGRIEAYRGVLDRPEQLVVEAERLRGIDSE